MKSVELEINGVKVTALEDGSIVQVDGRFRDGRAKRTLGVKDGREYMRVYLGCRAVRVHRIIAEAFLPDFLDYPTVDHIDGDKSNNSVGNLRMVTKSENSQASCRKRGVCSSQYRGVHWDKESKNWMASCNVANARKKIGRFDNEYDAAVARDAYWFSQGLMEEGLNFPDLFKS